MQRWIVAGTLSFAPILAAAQVPVPVPRSQLDPELAEFMRTAEYAFAFQAGGLMLLVVAVVAMALFFANQREKRKQDLIVRFVEKGQEVPNVLLPQFPSRPRELRRGVWLASLGFGIGSVLYITTGDWQVAAWCLILLFLSVASFINAAMFYGEHDADKRTIDSH